ncbi:MAG: hypothetical protein ACI4DP_12760 [Candidatus Ornithomonoglobus sp.]
MAEHYGVVPKRFTKEWWPYYWMYYKWQTIGIAFALVLIIVTMVQCATKEKYDVIVNYIGETYFEPETAEGIEAALEPLIEDVDGNGENNVFFQQLTLNNTAGSEEMDYTLQMKHDVGLTDETSYLYMYDKEEAELMLGRESADDVYLPLSEWCDTLDTEAAEGSDILCSESGVPMAVLAEDSELLKSVGMDTTGLYIAVRKNYSDEEINMAAYRSAAVMANAILK